MFSEKPVLSQSGLHDHFGLWGLVGLLVGYPVCCWVLGCRRTLLFLATIAALFCVILFAPVSEVAEYWANWSYLTFFALYPMSWLAAGWAIDELARESKPRLWKCVEVCLGCFLFVPFGIAIILPLLRDEFRALCLRYLWWSDRMSGICSTIQDPDELPQACINISRSDTVNSDTGPACYSWCRPLDFYLPTAQSYTCFRVYVWTAFALQGMWILPGYLYLGISAALAYGLLSLQPVLARLCRACGSRKPQAYSFSRLHRPQPHQLPRRPQPHQLPLRRPL